MEQIPECRLKKIVSPYNLRETCGWIVRNFSGIRKNRRHFVAGLPHSFVLNENLARVHSAIFIGDIMDMNNRALKIGPDIKEFVAGVDFLVGNFEATITQAKGAVLAQRHAPQILDALENLFPPQNTYLSVANNHAGDFGKLRFNESLNQIKSRGFNTFGTKFDQYIDIGPKIRVIAGSRWSNQKCAYLGDFNKISEQIETDRFNILYPHWGYELEQFPRPETVGMAKEFLTKFDAIIGHHSHNPQPIVKVAGSPGHPNKLVAYGLGDFCIWETLKHYLYGILLKIEIGEGPKGKLQVGKIEWEYVKSRAESDKIWLTEITRHYPFL